MLAETWPLFTTDMAQELKSARGELVEITPQSINNLSVALVNTSRPPFDNPEMRRALRLAADRKETFEKIYGGIGVPCVLLDPAISGKYALPVEEVQAMPGCRQPKDEDLAEASRIVKKHYPEGVEIQVITRILGEAVDRSQLLVAQLRKVGIRGTLKTYESAAGFAAYRRLDEYHLVGFQDIGNSIPDPSAPFGLLFHSTSNFNVGHWKNERVDRLIDEGIREANVEKRVAIYHELQRILLKEDAPAIILGAAYGWNFRDTRLQNFRPGPTMFDNNTFMKVWLKE
jgi:peptide/nickel transport system substrate-binding protein